MKNKKATYLLLVLVLVIWGVVFYRIFTRVSSDNGMVVKAGNATMQKMNFGNSVPDTFQLSHDYKDPFLRDLDPYRRNRRRPQPRPAPKPDPEPKEEKEKDTAKKIDWSFIRYKGIIENQSNRRKVGLVQVYNNQYMVQKKDTIKNVRFLELKKDCIKVGYKNEDRYILKK